jgi:hypothetical protein
VYGQPRSRIYDRTISLTFPGIMFTLQTSFKPFSLGGVGGVKSVSRNDCEGDKPLRILSQLLPRIWPLVSSDRFGGCLPPSPTLHSVSFISWLLYTILPTLLSSLYLFFLRQLFYFCTIFIAHINYILCVMRSYIALFFSHFIWLAWRFPWLQKREI